MNSSISEAPKEGQMLVVDDEAPVAQLVEQTILKAGYKCWQPGAGHSGRKTNRRGLIRYYHAGNGRDGTAQNS
jgi:hypothetical protein